MRVREFAPTIYNDLHDPEFALEYLQAGWEADMATFLVSLRDIIQARGGMSQLAEATGLSRESLYKTLSPTGNPQLATIQKILCTLGYDFTPIRRVTDS